MDHNNKMHQSESALPYSERGEVKRILSIDGGGIKGVFPAAFLANLESDLDQPIGRYFDLIAGTSTGGIIALGLAMGMTARELLSLYEEEGPAIFSQDNPGRFEWLRRLGREANWYFNGPKFSSDPLESALVASLGDRRIAEAQTRLLVPSWHPLTQEVYIFKTPHHSRLKTDYKERAVDVALATAAAPTYFKQHYTANEVGLVDGGVWANNPVGLAVVEAVGVLGWPADELQVLSVGCLDDVREYKKAYGAIRFSLDMVDMFMAGQSHGSLGTAHILLGDPHRRKALHRVSQPVPHGFYKMDDTRRISELKDRAFAEARKQKPIVEKYFLATPAEPFKPLYRCQNEEA